MGSLVLYVIEWAFALLVLLAVYKVVFSKTTLYRFNRFYLLGATLLSALLPLVHVTFAEESQMMEYTIIGTEFAQELTTASVADYMPMDEDLTPDRKTSLWAVALICTYSIYVITLLTGWTRGILTACRFIRGKKRRRLSRTVWLVTHGEAYGPFSWMNFIVISDTEKGFSRRASLRHEYSHVKLLHSLDLIFLLACTIVNPACWLVLHEIKTVHEYEADNEVITRYAIIDQDYQRLLIMKAVGAEAYALASTFNLNIKKRIVMMNKNKTAKKHVIWLLLLIPMLGMTSLLFARSEKSLDIDPFGITLDMGNSNLKTLNLKVIDEKGKPVADALVSENPSRSPVVTFSFLGFTDKKGEFTLKTPDGRDFFSVAKEGYKPSKIRFDNVEGDEVVITLTQVVPGQESVTPDEDNIPAFNVKQRNLMRVIVLKDGKVHVKNGVIDRKVKPAKLNDLVKRFITNPANDDRLPLIEEYEVEGFGTINTTVRHALSLERDPAAGIEQRDEVFGILLNAYSELRDEWCLKEFGKKYDECTQEQQSYARGMYPTKILTPEMRYYCDFTIDIMADGLTAYVDRTDAMTGLKSDVKRELDYGRILKGVSELEDYINQVVDPSSRIRSVKLRIYPDAPTGVVSDVKMLLRQKNASSLTYMSVTEQEEQVFGLTLVPQTVKAGDVIHGTVVDAADGNPIFMANVYEMDSRDRIRAHGLADINGDFALRVVDPNDYLRVVSNGYMETRRPVSNGRIVMIKEDASAPKNAVPAAQPQFQPQTEPESAPEPDENGVYTTVDDMPEFPGGVAAMLDYMRRNIEYPAEAREAKIEGRVIVRFIVNEDGHLSDIEATTSVDEILAREALRMVSTMPNWKPGSNRGFPVKVRYSLPVNFRLNNDTDEPKWISINPMNGQQGAEGTADEQYMVIRLSGQTRNPVSADELDEAIKELFEGSRSRVVVPETEENFNKVRDIIVQKYPDKKVNWMMGFGR